MSGAINATVHNPLGDITNAGSRSGSHGNCSDFNRDVIVIDKENVTVRDSVSPSPCRHRSRFVASKVCVYIFLCLMTFLMMLTFHFQVSQGSQNGSLNSRDEVSFQLCLIFCFEHLCSVMPLVLIILHFS